MEDIYDENIQLEQFKPLKGETGNFEGSPCPNVIVNPMFKLTQMPIQSILVILGAMIVGQVQFIVKVFPGTSGLICESTSELQHSMISENTILAGLKQTNVAEEKFLTTSIQSKDTLGNYNNQILDNDKISQNNVNITKAQRIRKFHSTVVFQFDYSEVELKCDNQNVDTKKYGPVNLCQYQANQNWYLHSLFSNNSRQMEQFPDATDPILIKANKEQVKPQYQNRDQFTENLRIQDVFNLYPVLNQSRILIYSIAFFILVYKLLPWLKYLNDVEYVSETQQHNFQINGCLQSWLVILISLLSMLLFILILKAWPDTRWQQDSSASSTDVALGKLVTDQCLLNNQFRYQMTTEKQTTLDGQCNCSENKLMMISDQVIVYTLLIVAFINMFVSSIGYITQAVKDVDVQKPN